MICVADELSLLMRLEQRLHQSRGNLRGQRTLVKEHKQLEKELATVLRKRQNLQAYDVFELGMPVHRINSSRLGIVKELKITPGGWEKFGSVGMDYCKFQMYRICYRLTMRQKRKLLQWAIA